MQTVPLQTQLLKLQSRTTKSILRLVMDYWGVIGIQPWPPPVLGSADSLDPADLPPVQPVIHDISVQFILKRNSALPMPGMWKPTFFTCKFAKWSLISKKNPFTGKFAVNRSLYIPPHLKRAATLARDLPQSRHLFFFRWAYYNLSDISISRDIV